MGVIGLMLPLNDVQIDLYEQLPYWAKLEIQRYMIRTFKVELTYASFAVDKIRKVKNINNE